MSARDDYPWHMLQNDLPSASARYGQMCDEIDALRETQAENDRLLDENNRLRTALMVPQSTEPFTRPLERDDPQYGYWPDSFVLDMPNVQLVVSRAEVRSLADWFMLAGCDIGVYLLEEIGEEP